MPGRAARTLALALLMLVAATLGLEVFWRAGGHRPSIVDDEDLWCRERERASLPGAVVLIGASRLRWGFSPQTFHERHPERPLVQLCDRWSPVAVLRDLAADERFRGIVVASVGAERLERFHWEDQQHLVDYCRTNWSPSNELNRALRIRVESTFVLANPIVGILEVGRRLVDGRGLPEPLWIRTFADRSRQADFQARSPGFARVFERKLLREQALRGAEMERSLPSEWLAGVLELEPYVERIQARGGRVVFVRLPTSGERWEIDSYFYPKARYWDELTRSTAAVTIHFLEAPGMRSFELLDGSHVDYRDAARYTEVLLDELSATGVLP